MPRNGKYFWDSIVVNNACRMDETSETFESKYLPSSGAYLSGAYYYGGRHVSTNNVKFHLVVQQNEKERTTKVILDEQTL